MPERPREAPHGYARVTRVVTEKAPSPIYQPRLASPHNGNGTIGLTEPKARNLCQPAPDEEPPETPFREVSHVKRVTVESRGRRRASNEPPVSPKEREEPVNEYVCVRYVLDGLQTHDGIKTLPFVKAHRVGSKVANVLFGIYSFGIRNSLGVNVNAGALDGWMSLCQESCSVTDTTRDIQESSRLYDVMRGEVVAREVDSEGFSAGCFSELGLFRDKPVKSRHDLLARFPSRAIVDPKDQYDEGNAKADDGALEGGYADVGNEERKVQDCNQRPECQGRKF